MVLTKAELIKQLMLQDAKLSKPTATEFVEQFFEEISRALISGEEVKLAGLGVFRILEKKARQGRNPKTGEAAIIAPRRVATFLPSKTLQKHISKKNP